MMKYSIVEIADILGVDYHSISNEEATVSQLLTDSRSLNNPEETIFFAIKTANNDGHNYIAPLYQKGVRNFVVNRIDNVMREMRDANFLVVPDTLEALQTLATSHRRRFNIPVIGITGSRGKTTVKEWLNHAVTIRKSACHSRCGTSTPTPRSPLSKPAFPPPVKWTTCKP